MLVELTDAQIETLRMALIHSCDEHHWCDGCGADMPLGLSDHEESCVIHNLVTAEVAWDGEHGFYSRGRGDILS